MCYLFYGEKTLVVSAINTIMTRKQTHNNSLKLRISEVPRDTHLLQ